MPDCPNCGTWNPDDKLVCWRCQTEMPKPKPEKKKPVRFLGMPVWSWVVLALMVAFWLLVTCLGPRLSTAVVG